MKRFDIYLVNLDPTIGSEIKKTRPCLIVSPDEMNEFIRTVIVAPMTTKGRPYPTRVRCRFQQKSGQVVLDQLRTVDKLRLVRRLGRLDGRTQNQGPRCTPGNVRTVGSCQPQAGGSGTESRT